MQIKIKFYHKIILILCVVLFSGGILVQYTNISYAEVIGVVAPPVVKRIISVPTPTKDSTPNYTFNTNKAGTIVYGGSCSSATTIATVGDNTITFNKLADGIYSNCTILVKDELNKASNILLVNTFTVDTSVPPTFDFSKLDIKFDKDYVKNKKALKEKVKFHFKNTEGIAYYRASTYKELDSYSWKPMADSVKLEIDEWNKEKGEKQKFYFQFQAKNGAKSDVESKKVTYHPKEKRAIKQSSKKVRKGEILIQKGKRFKKNRDVALYFSKPGGGYYEPMIVRTNRDGVFEVQYVVNKPVGEYKWYAKQLSTGKKSEVLKYKIVE
jgi:hypothetical protein